MGINGLAMSLIGVLPPTRLDHLEVSKCMIVPYPDHIKFPHKGFKSKTSNTRPGVLVAFNCQDYGNWF